MDHLDQSTNRGEIMAAVSPGSMIVHSPPRPAWLQTEASPACSVTTAIIVVKVIDADAECFFNHSGFTFRKAANTRLFSQRKTDVRAKKKRHQTDLSGNQAARHVGEAEPAL